MLSLSWRMDWPFFAATSPGRTPWAAGLAGGLERVKGIEPSYEAWEAAVLPLNYTRGLKPKFSASRTEPAVKMALGLRPALALGTLAQRLAEVSQVQFLQFEETR